MTASLEVPFRPGWPAPQETRIEPPLVSVEPRWEYSIVVRDIADGPLSEPELNALDAEHWELVGNCRSGGTAPLLLQARAAHLAQWRFRAP
jgi:hypothetical protein